MSVRAQRMRLDVSSCTVVVVCPYCSQTFGPYLSRRQGKAALQQHYDEHHREDRRDSCRECDAPVQAKGLCAAHYRRERRRLLASRTPTA